MDWFDFHEKGNTECPACAVPPTLCWEGRGLVHSQFDDEDDFTLVFLCDHCAERCEGPLEIEEVV